MNQTEHNNIIWYEKVPDLGIINRRLGLILVDNLSLKDVEDTHPEVTTLMLDIASSNATIPQ